MKICPGGAEVFHVVGRTNRDRDRQTETERETDRLTDRHNAVVSLFSFFQSA